MFNFSRIREYENLHILLWLLKDTCWVLNWEVAGLIMIIPTIGVALHITWLRRSVKSELFTNLAVSLWISGNSTWMIGEFFYDDGLRTPALMFFLTGLIIVFYYHLIEQPKNRKNTTPPVD